MAGWSFRQVIFSPFNMSGSDAQSLFFLARVLQRLSDLLDLDSKINGKLRSPWTQVDQLGRRKSRTLSTLLNRFRQRFKRWLVALPLCRLS
jgi:hypothetical protein